MRKILLTMTGILLAFMIQSQGINNSGARIVSESGTSWVLTGGGFTLTSQSAANLATMANLRIEADASLIIGPQSFLTVNGTLTNSGGNAGLVIESTADGTGSLINSTEGVQGTVERYIPAAEWETWNDGWHYLSSPVASQAIYPEFVTTWALVNENFYKWDEPTNLWINIKNADGTAWTSGFETSFVPGRGYLVAYASLVTKNFTGNLNVSNVPLSDLTLSSGPNSGWYLLGNPFTSALTWYTGWNITNFGGVANIWNEEGRSYSPLNPGEPIPACNGFMVHLETLTGSLTIPAAKRTHDSRLWYKNSDYPVLKLFAHNPDDHSFQESQVRFNPASTTGFDLEYDGRFLKGYAPLFYSVMSGENLMVNSLPELKAETVIPFSFIKSDGTSFTIEAMGIETLEPPFTVFLRDNKLGINRNLSENPVYTFTSASGDDPARFELRFGSVGINELPVTQTISAWYNVGSLYVNAGGGITNIDIFNVQGRNIQNYRLHGSGLQSISINLPAGVYFARIVNDDRMKTVKIIIQ